MGKMMIPWSFTEWYDVHSDELGIDLPFPEPLKQQPIAIQNDWKEWVERYEKKEINKEELKRGLEQLLKEMGVISTD